MYTSRSGRKKGRAGVSSGDVETASSAPPSLIRSWRNKTFVSRQGHVKSTAGTSDKDISVFVGKSACLIIATILIVTHYISSFRPRSSYNLLKRCTEDIISLYSHPESSINYSIRYNIRFDIIPPLFLLLSFHLSSFIFIFPYLQQQSPLPSAGLCIQDSSLSVLWKLFQSCARAMA